MENCSLPRLGAERRILPKLLLARRENGLRIRIWNRVFGSPSVKNKQPKRPVHCWQWHSHRHRWQWVCLNTRETETMLYCLHSNLYKLFHKTEFRTLNPFTPHSLHYLYTIATSSSHISFSKFHKVVWQTKACIYTWLLYHFQNPWNRNQSHSLKLKHRLTPSSLQKYK